MYTFNGVGTTLYGKRDPAPDGSYVATKWVVLVFVPIIPLASYRVWEGETTDRFLGSSTEYRLERLPLQWRQVLNWYLATVFFGPLLAYIIITGLFFWAVQKWR